ncbi:MAG: 23S rRNA (guanosine(2251)-2'-O)-methyltransferase RlmB [Clostridiaceae bacterium]|jgi:23S rRNA (guanosine2251-2'-O)-methyltransferase|nr:23S rRNA (guanosine(2251)-2'-O)-methyltransferase RlmB [Clostridiaceae bacterium]
MTTNSTKRTPRDQPEQPRKHNENTPVSQIEGRHPITEALRAGRPINRVFVLESARTSRRKSPLAELAQQCRDQGAIVVYANRATLDKMALSEGHQGIIAEMAAHDYADLDDVLQETERYGKTPFLLLLDHVQDPQNLGSILRIADGAGVTAVVIPKRRSVPLNAAVAKASAGAIEYVPVVRVTNLSQTILSLKDRGFWIFGTDATAETRYDNVDFTGKIALVIGSEGAGIARNIRNHCDVLLSIPLYGHINSLNAAVACGIVAFEAARKRRQKS